MAINNRVLFVTDLHGNMPAMRRAFDVARVRKVGTMIIGADLGPKKHGLLTSDNKIIPVSDMPADTTSSLRMISRQQNPERQLVELRQRGYYFMRTPLSFAKINDEMETLDLLCMLLTKIRYQLNILSENLPSITAHDIQRIRELLLPTIKKIEEDIKTEKPWFEKELAEKIQASITEIGSPFSTSLAENIIRILDDVVYLRGARAKGSKLDKDTVLRINYDHVVFNLVYDFFGDSFWDHIKEKLNYAVLGDMAEGKEAARTGQLEFFREFLIPEISAFKRSMPKADIFLQLGNDDIKENEGFFLDLMRASKLFRYLNDRVYKLNNRFFIGGYSYIPDIPFDYKDWVKTEQEILLDLRSLFGSLDPKRTVLSLHAPPHGTLLDQVERERGHRESFGSIGTLEFIKIFNPYLVLTGHCHESPLLTGTISQMIGDSLVIQPGALHEKNKDGVDAVIVDLESRKTIIP